MWDYIVPETVPWVVAGDTMEDRSVKTKGNAGGDAKNAYSAYVEEEESLLEQIRSKEEEQNARIAREETLYNGEIELAKKDAEKIVSEGQALGQKEADTIRQDAMGRISAGEERIRQEGDVAMAAISKQGEERMDTAVKRVVSEVKRV